MQFSIASVPGFVCSWRTSALATEPVRMTAREVTGPCSRPTPARTLISAAADLNGLDLADLDFKGARLPGANLYGADLSHANLSGTDLTGARLDRATITSADFSGADLTDARILRPTIFTTLEVVSSEAPKFTGAKLVRIRSDGWLDRADFSDADLTSAVFGGGAIARRVALLAGEPHQRQLHQGHSEGNQISRREAAATRASSMPICAVPTCAVANLTQANFSRCRPDRRRRDRGQPRRGRSPQRARPRSGDWSGYGLEHRQGSAGLDALVLQFRRPWTGRPGCQRDVILGLVPRIHGVHKGKRSLGPCSCPCPPGKHLPSGELDPRHTAQDDSKRGSAVGCCCPIPPGLRRYRL